MVIPLIATLYAMAWATGCALATPPPQERQFAVADQLHGLRSETNWQRVGFERVVDDPNLAALDEDDDREEVLESIRPSLIIGFDHPVSTSSVATALVSDSDSRGDSPGGRRGPPPRMPPA
ncbi:hypothetical protein V5E97_17575 [Singulisphaera sp. Ch08]|uniref:Uncharacterized protein n=1 Tax=Singulisphaera sp. Ch08 TaxID=3120278 RepID=A0AAU7CRS1_9BACT